MKALLQAELIKLRTTRTFVALAGIAVLTSLVFTALSSLLGEPTRKEVLYDVFNSDTSSLFILILAIVGIAGEWRHRTITSALLAAPDRIRFLAAKTLAFAAAGVVLSLVIAVAVATLGTTILSIRDLPLPEVGEVAAQYARNALVSGLLGALGVGFGVIFRNQLIAIVGVLLLMFFVEPTLVALVPDVGRFGPLGVLPVAAADLPPEEWGLEDLDLLSPGLAALALLAWIGAAFAAGAALLRARDLH